MRTQREITSLSPLHRASVALHTSLQLSENKEHRRNRSLLSSTAINVLSSTKKKSNLTHFIESHDMNEKIAGQVRALANFVAPEKNHKLEELIEKQNEDRRSRHLNLIKKYEAWAEKYNGGLAVNENSVLKKWDAFIRASEKELDLTISELNEDSLLRKEIDYVQSAFDNLENHTTRRKEEAKNLILSLLSLEKDREKTTTDALNTLKHNMTEVAFLLERDIKDIISKYKTQANEIILQKKELAYEIDEKNIISTEEFHKTYTEKLKNKLSLWKTLHHNSVLSKFIDIIDSKKFVNPEEREKILKDLQAKQLEIYNIRIKASQDLCQTSLKILTKQYVDEKIEELSLENDKIQEDFDESVQKMLNLQKIVFQEMEELFQTTQDRLFYIGAYEKLILTDIIDKECRNIINKRKEEWQELMKKIIKYLEDSDTRSQEVTINCLNFIKNVAGVSDEQKRRNDEEEKKYQTDLALRGDFLDENVENLEGKFNGMVGRLKRTITENDLEKALQDTMAVLEEIAVEHRKYTDQASDMMSLHKYKIVDSYLVFVTRILEKFGLASIERKDEIIALMRLKRGVANEGKKTPEEPKRRPTIVKEVLEVKNIEIEEVEILGRKWLVHKPLKDIIKELLFTEDDKEKEIQRKLREEEKRKEEERKAQEEAQKKEESKKLKTKPTMRFEEPKKENLSPFSTLENDENQGQCPIDPEGNFCLLDTLHITSSFLTSILTKLHVEFSVFISETESLAITSANESDNLMLEQIREELDEKLRFLWPRKGKLEVNEYSTRSLEIKRHHNRWDRFISEILPKKDQHNKEFSQLHKEFTEMLVKYKKDQDLIRLQLPKTNSIAEFQGLMRKNKDFEQQLYQKGMEMLDKMQALAIGEVEKLISSFEDFLTGLQLFEKGGDYDLMEVEYYRDKAKIISNELGNEQNKRKDIIEALKKKFENDRLDPVKNFERDYANALELLAAREGIGKKYGAPKRSAQEKIRGEMTKCEKAQEGIDSVLQSLNDLVQEYQNTLSSKSEHFFLTRDPSLSISIRKILISFRLCLHKYGQYISAFKDENQSNIKSLTWKEDTLIISSSLEESSAEPSRIELLLEPLQELAVLRTPGNFSQKIGEIEKNARDECLKLYSGKNLPEAVDRYFKIMRYYAEEFRTNRCKVLRETALKALEIEDKVAEATIQSIGLACECMFEDICEKTDRNLAGAYEKEEMMRKVHQKALRPNLANPSCLDELEKLNEQETERYDRGTLAIKEAKDHFVKGLKTVGDMFRVKLANNVETLLYLFDNMLVYEDFAYVPGDEAPEVKRSHIKKLASKKKTKLSDSNDSRGKKKIWTAVLMSSLKIPGEALFADIPALGSYKGEGQKVLIGQRNQAFNDFSMLFDSKVHEYLTRFNRLMVDEEGWTNKWRDSIEILRSKNA